MSRERIRCRLSIAWVLRLRGDGAHSRLLNRSPYRLRIRRVGLVRLHKRPDKLRMQQHELVSERLNFTCPPMSAPARFKSDTPGGLSQKRDQIVTAKPPIRNLAGLGVDPVQLKHRFATSSPCVVEFIWGLRSSSGCVATPLMGWSTPPPPGRLC